MSPFQAPFHPALAKPPVIFGHKTREVPDLPVLSAHAGAVELVSVLGA
jgi:hypothetical protein